MESRIYFVLIIMLRSVFKLEYDNNINNNNNKHRHLH